MNSDLQKWNEQAGNWDSKIAISDSYRTALITDALDQLFSGDCSGLKILDAGCGNGYFTKWLAQKGALVEGIDGSEEMVKIAQAKYPDLNFKSHDLLKPLPSEKSEYFDVILANMLLMHMSEVGTFLKEASRILKPGGKFVFSVLHPAFNRPTSRLYKSFWDKITLSKPKAIAENYYQQNTGRFESHMNSQLTHYHRTIQDYSQELKRANFVISEIVEPHKLPDELLRKNPKLEYAQRLPRFIFFNCTKI